MKKGVAVKKNSKPIFKRDEVQALLERAHLVRKKCEAVQTVLREHGISNTEAVICEAQGIIRDLSSIVRVYSDSEAPL